MSLDVLIAGGVVALAAVQAARLALEVRQHLQARWAKDAHHARNFADYTQGFNGDLDECLDGLRALGLSERQIYRRLQALASGALARRAMRPRSDCRQPHVPGDRQAHQEAVQGGRDARP